jgi:hypothetical protein
LPELEKPLLDQYVAEAGALQAGLEVLHAPAIEAAALA